MDYLSGLLMDFDRYFLKISTKDLFKEEANKLQMKLTDKMIANAFSVWPTEISQLNASEIQESISARRNQLVEIALQFKDILDKEDFLSEPLKGSEDLDLLNFKFNALNANS